MSIPTISTEQFARLCRQSDSVQLVDVRTPAEYEELHLENARNVPLDRLDPEAIMRAHNGTSEESLYIVCQLGGRGRQACEKFQKAGFNNVVNVEGGTTACVASGVPVVRGKKMISLERQVRIMVGSLVLLGSVLGWFVHLAFIGIAAFVGAGLVFAGVSDTCGMGMLLARMPWNQGGASRLSR